MTVIDLGETRGRTTNGPPVERPAGRRRNPVLVAVAVLALTLMGAAVPARGPLARLGSLHAMPGDPLYVVGSTAYLAKIRENPSVVEAYDVRDGSRRWTAPYPFDASSGNTYLEFDLTDGMLTLHGESAGGLFGAVALDSATGRTRWSVASEYGELDRHRMLVGDAHSTTLSLMDQVSGVTLWTIPFAGCVVGSFDDRRTVAVRCDHGRTLQLVDAVTGAVRAVRHFRRRSPVDPPFNDDMGSYSALFVGDVLAVGFGAGDARWIDALSPTDLSTVWASKAFGSTPVSLFDCNGDLCVQGPLNSHLDPATGALLSDAISPDTPPDSVQQLDVLGGGGRTRPPAIVLDPHPAPVPTIASGRDTVLEMYDGRNEVPIFAGGYPTWVLRAVPDRRATYGYRFSIVGKLNGVLAIACFTTTRYLACATAANTLTFFDLPPEDRAR